MVLMLVYFFLPFLFIQEAKLKIVDTVNSVAPILVKYQLQTLFVKDKLWGQIPNFDNWLTEFNILDHYWKNKK